MFRTLLVALIALSPSAVITSAHAAASEAPAEAVAWVECLQAYGDRHVASDASVETIATAALGSCRDQEYEALATRMKRPTALRFVLGPLSRSEREVIREDHERVREEFRERLIGDLLEQRSSMQQATRK